jgi:hypothetical protein
VIRSLAAWVMVLALPASAGAQAIYYPHPFPPPCWYEVPRCGRPPLPIELDSWQQQEHLRDLEREQRWQLMNESTGRRHIEEYHHDLYDHDRYEE